MQSVENPMSILARNLLSYDAGVAAGALTSRDRQLVELAALQNALNGNIFSVVSGALSLPRGVDHPGPTRCSPRCQALPVGLALPVVPASPGGEMLPAKCDRYKTELCRTYQENGTCRYGDKCQFAHGVAELRTVARHPKYKTDLCRTFHTTGFCPYGSRCHFIHSLQETLMPIQSPDLLVPQMAVKSPHLLPSAPVNSTAQNQSVNNLMQTLATLLASGDLPADNVNTTLLAQEYARRLAAIQTAECPPRANRLPRGLSFMSDTTSMSADSMSPCPSPTSLVGSGIDDQFAFRPQVLSSSGFQSPVWGQSSCVLTPPGSPTSATSSLASSQSSDFDASDSIWPRSVWPSLLSPVKDVSHIPTDFAQSHLLRSSRSIFA